MKTILLLILCFISLTQNVFPGWVVQNSGTRNSLRSVWFVNPNVGYAVGSGGTILKTIDGGATWNQPAGNIYSTFVFRDVAFPSPDTGYMAGADPQHNVMFQTTDGGATWLELLSGHNFYFYALCFTDLCTVYATGPTAEYTGEEIYRTTDCGEDWQVIYGSLIRTAILHDISYPDDTSGFVCGAEGMFIKTLSPGLICGSWEELHLPVPYDLLSMSFLDKNMGFVAGNHGTIMKTTDGGISWSDQSVNPAWVISSIFFINADTGYAAGYDSLSVSTGIILKTIDGGNSWNLQYISSQRLNAIFFTGADTGYAAGEEGLLLNTMDGGGPLKIIERKKKAELSISPNPARECIEIRFNDPGDISASVSVFGPAGNEVKTQQVINDPLTLDISDLPPGLYFVRVSKGDFIRTGKFVKAK